MTVIDIDIKNINLEENHDINLCLGFFDGVHLGHQQLINESVKNGPTGVMTFDVPPHFIKGEKIYKGCLTSLRDKINLFFKLGVDYVYVLRMSEQLLNTSKEDFVNKILKAINPKSLYVGEDYRFGYKAKGTPEFLSQYFDTTVLPLLIYENVKIGSTYIKEFISNGDMEKAAAELGRPYSITGMVVDGKHNGSKMGFPTANLYSEFPYYLPKIGVYIGYAVINGERYKSIIAVSTHPTIMELKMPIIEVHILDFQDDLYGKQLNVEFTSYIRDIIKFKNLDELKSQLEKDKELAKNTLK